MVLVIMPGNIDSVVRFSQGVSMLFVGENSCEYKHVSQEALLSEYEGIYNFRDDAFRFRGWVKISLPEIVRSVARYYARGGD